MLYFAYGSNMNEDELRNIGVTILRAEKAILRDHKISLTHNSVKRKGGTLDILPSKGNIVEGVFYEIPDKDKSKINTKEGVKSNSYKKIKVDIENMAGKVISNVISYQVCTRVDPQPVSEEYKNSVLEGAETHDLSENYKIKLKAMLKKKEI